jgi:ABC-type amino acid transport substrate-binding protein
VNALDRGQTRAIAGPRADPAAFTLIRPYLREAVYIEVTEPAAGGVPRRRLRWRRWRPQIEVTGPAAGTPYWLVATRHPAELAAAINSARPAARAGGTAMG